MPHISRRTKWIVAFIVVIVVGYGLTLFWQSQNQVPTAFVNARSQSAIIAQNIVSISNQSNATLAEVNADDAKGDYKDALTLVSSTIAQSEDLRNQAVQLSNQIEQMTQAVGGINSSAEQQAAFEAISAHLALINQLINYSGDLNNLLDALQARFAGAPGGSVADGATIQSLVNQVNTDVAAINNFNNQASQAMQQFDTLTSK
jgi:dynactin complex subunit